jgi:hypothetical protein
LLSILLSRRTMSFFSFVAGGRNRPAGIVANGQGGAPRLTRSNHQAEATSPASGWAPSTCARLRSRQRRLYSRCSSRRRDADGLGYGGPDVRHGRALPKRKG